MKLENKIAIVVGGAGGMGRETALHMAREGANVIVADLNFKKAIAVYEEVKQIKKEDYGFALEVDVRKSDEVKSMVEKVVNKFGRIDILANFAGILEVSPFIKIEEEEWDNVMAVNVKGTFLVCKEVAKQMIKQKGGKIINTSSIAAKKAIALHAHYCASKFAIVGLTQALAIELAPYNINVNCICPGDVDTDMFKKSQKGIAKEKGISYEECRKISLSNSLFKRFEQSKDVAPLVVFLASDDANFMTGQAINVAGGIQFN
jgi:NAD(P)-dependent dehydrogenase (short-subunit alcohol dehydrogenase family)